MGLNIEACQHVRLVKPMTLNEFHALEELGQSTHMLYDENEPFYLRNDGRPILIQVPDSWVPDSWARSPWSNLPSGLYEASGIQRTFSIGSYSHFNEWRTELARITDAPSWPPRMSREWLDRPFGPLLMCSDSDGFFSADASGRLYKDFALWLEREWPSWPSWNHVLGGRGQYGSLPSNTFLPTYFKLMEAFDIARVMCREHEDCIMNQSLGLECAERSGQTGGVVKFA